MQGDVIAGMSMLSHESGSRNGHRLQPIALVLLLALWATPWMHAQIASGGITGTVKDTSGAVIADSQVSLTNDQTGVVQSTHSTSTGTYVFESVPAGTYTLRVAHPGFQDVVIKGVQVHVQFVLTEDASLPVGAAQQEVTVNSAAPLLQAESAAIGTTIESKQIVDLPLNGRNWASLSQLAAGVTTASTQFSGAPGSAYFAVDGINPWQMDFRLDGIDDNVELYGGPGPTNSNGALQSSTMKAISGPARRQLTGAITTPAFIAPNSSSK